MPTFKRSQPRPGFLHQINPFLKIGISFGLISLALLLKSLPAMAALVGVLFLLMTQIRVRPVLLLYGVVTLTVFFVFSGL